MTGVAPAGRVRPAAAPRIPPHLIIILAASFVSDVGLGLTLPFLLIYLHEARHIGLGSAGLLITVAGVASLPAASGVGFAVDRLGLRCTAVIAVLVQAAGPISLVFASGVASATGVMLLLGLGQGAAYTVWFALLGALSHDERLRPRIFALNAQLLNLGLVVGAVLGGASVRVANPASFVTVYLADGASDLLVIVVLLLLPAVAFARASSAGSGTDTAGGRRRRGYRAVLADRTLVRYLAVAFALAIGGYGSLDAGFVGFATAVVRVPPVTISLSFAANMLFIVLAQPVALRLAARVRRTTALALGAGTFGSSWIVLGVASRWPGSTAGEALTVAALVVFGVAEVILTPVAVPLVNDIAPADLTGRYNATSSFVSSLGNVVGPAIAGEMLGAGLGLAYIAVLVLSCAAGIASAHVLRRVLGDQLDRPS